VDLTSKQLAGFDYVGVAKNLRQSLQVDHWIGHRLYPQLLGQLARYFTAARIEPKAFNEDWQAFLGTIRRNRRCDQGSRNIIEDISAIYAGRLEMVGVDPQAIRSHHAFWELATVMSGPKIDMGFLSSFIKMVGDHYYRQKDPEALEKSFVCYCHAWGLDVDNMDAGLYLANIFLYDLEDGNQRLNRRYRALDDFSVELDRFVGQLFRIKNLEYSKEAGRLWERILKCHIILATIFEKQGRWGPGGNSRTALFQWTLASRALGKVRELSAFTRPTVTLLTPVVAKGLKNARKQASVR
jgi:hypothetical protein